MIESLADCDATPVAISAPDLSLFRTHAAKSVDFAADQTKYPSRIGLSVFFAFTAIGHFIRTDEMSAMLPPWVPYRGSIIYLTGVLELLGGHRSVVAGSDKIDGPLSHPDAHNFFPRQHLFGNQSNRIRRARSGSVLFAGASPVSTISDLVNSLVDRQKWFNK